MTESSPDNLNCLLEAIPFEVALVSADGVVLTVNSAWAQSGVGCFGESNTLAAGSRMFEHLAEFDGPNREQATATLAAMRDVLHKRQSIWQQELQVGTVEAPRCMRLTVRRCDDLADGPSLLLMREDITESRRLTAALQASEQKYRAVVEEQSEMITQFQPDGRLLFVNRSYQQAYADREPLVGRTLEEIFPELDQVALQADLARLTPQQPMRTDAHFLPIRLSDGSHKHIHQLWISRAFFDAAGRVTHYQSVGRDVSALKKSEQALRESNIRFEELTSHLEQIFWVFNWQTRQMEYVSPGFTTIFGRPVADLYRQPSVWISHVHVAERDRVLETFRQAAETPFDQTYRIVRGDGTQRWLRDRARPVLADDGQTVLRLVGLTDDVTALQESEERYRAAAEGAIDSFWLMQAVRDPGGQIIDFRIIDANSNAGALVSRPLEDVIGQRLLEMLPINRTLGTMEMYRETIDTGSTLTKEFPVQAREQGVVSDWLQIQSVKVGDGIAVTARDITARKATELELLRQREQTQTILNLVPALILYKDTENCILRCNQAFADMVGLPIHAIEGRSNEDFMPKAMSDAYYADDLQVIRSGEPKLGLIEPTVNSQGQERMIRTDKVPARDKDGRIVGVLAIATDITDLMQVNARLIESEGRYRYLFDRVPVAVLEEDFTALIAWLNDNFRNADPASVRQKLTTDGELRKQALSRIVIRAANQGAFDLLGVDTRDALQECLYGSDEIDAVSLVHQITMLLEGQSGHETESSIVTPDRRRLELLIRREMALSQTGPDPSRVIVAITDLGGRRQRLYAEAQIMQAERERKRLAHELHDSLGQQLTGVHMLAESLRRRLQQQAVPEASRLAELAALVGQANGEVRRLISGLSASQISADDLQDALESLAHRTVLVHRVDTQLRCPRPLPTLSDTTANHLLLIAQEAVHNAVKHAQPRHIEVGLVPRSGHLELTVRDDGNGFEQSDNSHTDRGQGLAIMQFRAQSIAAELNIGPLPRGGTLLVCRLPLASLATGENTSDE